MMCDTCFLIEEKRLYLEHVLVDYMDVPVFFLCNSDEEYYIVLCTDIEDLSYVLAQLSVFDVYQLLHGKLAMRDVFLKQEEYWEVISGEDPTLDTVTKHLISELDHSLLPEENACFEILTEEMAVFVREFDDKYWSAGYYKDSIVKKDLNITSVDVSFDMLAEHVKSFISLGEYLIESVLYDKKNFDNNFTYDESMPYMIHKKEKDIILQCFDEPNRWRINEISNIAA